MAHRVLWLRSFVVVAAVTALGAIVARGPAQDAGKQIGGEAELKPGWDEHNQTYYTLLRGDKKLDKNQMLKVAQAVSKWWVFRLTFITYKNDPPRMARLVKEFDDEITYKVLKTPNVEFQRIYAKELVNCFQQVLALDVFNPGDQPAVFNACALLPSIGRIKTEEMEKFFVDLVGDAKVHDSVRLSALKALAEVPPARVYTILDAAKKDPALDKQKAADLNRVNKLLAFITRPMPQNVTPEAERFMRRQALRALANCEVPAVEIDNVNKVHGPAAYGLLSALVKNKAGLNPPADLTERLEAAIGICKLQFNSKSDPRELYQADMGIYLVGMFLGDFIDAYRADHARFGTAVGVKKGKKGETLEVVPLQPWKSHAKRLEVALNTLVERSKTTPVDDKTKKFATYAQKFLADIQSHRAVLDTYDRAGIQNTWRPKEPTIFKKNKDKEPNFLE